MTTIRIEGIDEIAKKIRSLEEMKHVKGAIYKAAQFIELRLRASYPEKPHRPNPMIKLNPKVRRGFFYHLKEGNIEVPYRRGASLTSEDLQNSWTTRQENQGWRAVVGTNVSYARLVMDRSKQTQYHKVTGWPTVDDIAEKYGKQAIDIISQALKQEVEA